MTLALVAIGATLATTVAAQVVGNAKAAGESADRNIHLAPFGAPAWGFEQRRKSDAQGIDFVGTFPGYRVELGKTGMALNGGADPISITYAGARADVRVESQERQRATHSCFPSSNPSTWERNIPSFGRINYRGLYPGIDLSFYGKGERLEYDFLVQAGAHPGAIQLLLRGADKVSLDDRGNLVFSQGGKAFTLLKPVAYQPAITGLGSNPVDVRFVVGRPDGRGRQVRFRLGNYDPARPLVIDPVLVYGIYVPGSQGFLYGTTFYGGSTIAAMQADPADNTYTIGEVNSGTDGVETLMKFDPAGNLLWSASLGSGSGSLTPTAIAIGGTGEVYVAGNAYAGLPTTAGALQPVSTTSQPTGYVAAIAADGSSLDYGSYLGGSDATYPGGLAVDASGNLYITGNTNSMDFPTTPDAYFKAPGLSDYESENYNFVAKINPAGSGAASLLYSTLIGEVDGDAFGPQGLAVDASGNAYIVAVAAPGYPMTKGAYAYGGIAPSGSYVTKVNPTGTSLVYSAYLGPGTATAIAVDGSGAAYVTGTVQQDDFPVTAGAYQTAYPGGFALKLGPAGAALVYSTYLSGPSGAAGGVTPTSLAITPGCASPCALRVAGSTTTTDFPLIAPLQNQSGIGLAQGAATGFLVNINPNGAGAAYSSYLGGETSATTSYYGSPSVSVDKAGNVYFASNVEGFDAPITAGSLLDAAGGFLAKISEAGGAALVAVPGEVVFPAPAVVDTTASLSGAIQVRNVGSASLALERPFTFSSSEFTETDDCPSTLPAGGDCSLNLSFTPAASGTQTGTLRVSSATGESAAVNLTGAGLDDYNLVSTPAFLAFGDAVLNTPKAMALTLTNSGDQSLALTGISSSLPDFTIANHCPAQLASGAKCSLVVTFTPTQIGLQSGSIIVQVPGFYYYNGAAYPNEYSIPVAGTGLTASAGTGTIELSQPTYNFGNVIVGESSAIGYVAVTNAGASPITINKISMAVSQGSVAGDFHLSPIQSNGYPSNYCGGGYADVNGSLVWQISFPGSLGPESSCVVGVLFQPSITGSESATVSIGDSATGSPQTITFTGIGLGSAQALSVFPTAITFPVQPVGVASAPQTYQVVNGSDTTVTIDRISTTGDFVVDDGATGGCSGLALVPQATCHIQVAFLPKATGSRTGTLVLTDTSSGTPQVFSLAGTGITATGSLTAAATTLSFGEQAEGTTSTEQELIFSNPGNSTVTLNGFTTTGDFAVTTLAYTYNAPAACGTTLLAGADCQVGVVYSPTNSNGAETGTLTAHSSSGDVVVQLTGTSYLGTQSLAVEPTAVSMGPVLTGTSAENNNDQVAIYVINTGSDPVSFTSPLSISNPDFGLSGDCGFPETQGGAVSAIAPGASCSLIVDFQPSTTAAESATMTLTSTAGSQTIKLTGTGTTTLPAITVEPTILSFSPEAVGVNSGIYDYTTEFYIYNNTQAAIKIASVAVTAGSSDFSVSTVFQGCAGITIAVGSYCSAPILFQPAAAGYRTGKVTVKDSNGNAYAASLAGYGLSPVDSVTLTPEAFAFPDAIAPPGAASGSPQYESIAVTNTGSRPLTIGTVTATNVSSTGDFAFDSFGNCSGSTVAAGSVCDLEIAFTPQAVGRKTGSVTIPITYADKTTTTLTAQLTGTGVAANRAATLTPGTVAFPNTVSGQTQVNYQEQMTVTVTNSGTEAFTTGAATGTDLVTTSGQSGDFYLPYGSCNAVLAPTTSCSFTVGFEPRTTGNLTGSLSIPITYADGTKTTLTAALSGTGVAPAPALQLSATRLNFRPGVAGAGSTNNTEPVTLTNIGNIPATIKSLTASANFTVLENSCTYTISACTVSVAFTPAANTTPGTTTGKLTIVDNAPGSPQTVTLVGQTVSASQPLVVSQSTLSFPAQAAGTAGQPQVVYLTNLGSTTAVVNKLALSGADPGDFTMTQTCGGTLGFALAAQNYCTLSVAFTPQAASTGTRTATVVITPASGSALQIQLTGNALAVM